MEYRRQFYITLFSNASQKIHPSNTLAEFKIHLVQRIDLCSTDNCEVWLCEISCPPLCPYTSKPYEVASDTIALIYCDFITPQFVGNGHVRCLRTFTYPSKYCEYLFKNVYYVPAQKTHLPGHKYFYS